MTLLWVIIIVGVFLVVTSRNRQKNPETEVPPAPTALTEETVFGAEIEFEKKLENNYAPGSISGKEAYIYHELMKKWYDKLTADNRYNEQVTQRLRKDWLEYMVALEDRNTDHYLSMETEGKESKEYYDSHVVDSKKAFAIEDAFAAAVGKDAVNELTKARALEYGEFNHEGKRTPDGYQYDAGEKLQKIGKKSNSEEIKSPDDRISDELWRERIESGDVNKWDENNAFALAAVDSLRKNSVDSMEDQENKPNEIVGKYFVGENHDRPFEVVREKEGIMSYLYSEKGKRKANDLIADFLLTPGKAERVSDEEFSRAVKRLRKNNRN